jgi:DNA-binding LacI/PurR family transcriptional regulator
VNFKGGRLMKLIKYVNKHYEEERALVDLDSKEIILQGDYYHDKIDEKIEGYLKALEDHNIYTDEVEREEIGSKHEMYEELGFYNEEEED